jgi:hypothetical protein
MKYYVGSIDASLISSFEQETKNFEHLLSTNANPISYIDEYHTLSDHYLSNSQTLLGAFWLNVNKNDKTPVIIFSNEFKRLNRCLNQASNLLFQWMQKVLS